jgi:hypothetical protein
VPLSRILGTLTSWNPLGHPRPVTGLLRLTTLPPSCAVVKKSGNLNFLEPSGPLQACNGTALPLLLIQMGCNQVLYNLSPDMLRLPIGCILAFFRNRSAIKLAQQQIMCWTDKQDFDLDNMGKALTEWLTVLRQCADWVTWKMCHPSALH